MNNNKLLADFYSTTDIYLSASLVASGFKLIEIVKKDKQYSFYFLQDKEINYAITDYWNGEMKVDAKTLFGSFRDIKNRMYNQTYE